MIRLRFIDYAVILRPLNVLGTPTYQQKASHFIRNERTIVIASQHKQFNYSYIYTLYMSKSYISH